MACHLRALHNRPTGYVSMNRSLALVLRSEYIVTALGRSGVDRSQSASLS